jgi:hypothetical protein
VVYGAQTKGWKRGNLHEEASRHLAGLTTVEYDADEWSSGIVTNEDLAARVGTKLFVNVKVYHRVVVRSDKTIQIRWNSPTAPLFTVRAGEPFEETRMEITAIYLTTSDASSPVYFYAN